jgi:5-formyltetrahydrofolate cyclo-ligase
LGSLARNYDGPPLHATSDALTKSEIRKRIWDYLEEQNIARFPRPVYHRIPNFVGSETAAKTIMELREFKEASIIKVNPDSPQAHVRRIVLDTGRTLIIPTPRLSGGFLKVDPHQINKQTIRMASSISGAFRVGEKIPLSKLPKVDLIVAGSVAVSLDGGRIGKGEGFSELEFAILRDCGRVDDRTKIVTTVHDAQIVESFPIERYDIPVDYILTPTKLVETRTRTLKPDGIYWDLVTDQMLERMPILRELRSFSRQK